MQRPLIQRPGVFMFTQTAIIDTTSSARWVHNEGAFMSADAAMVLGEEVGQRRAAACLHAPGYEERTQRLDHARAPLLDAIHAYCTVDMMPFTTPGHKRGRGLDPEAATVLGSEIFGRDVPVANGIDDTRLTHGFLQQAERLAADAFGAERSFFLLGGSTLSNQIALLSTLGPGDEVIVARNAHKSVQTALALTGARPIYVRPRYDPELQIAHGITSDDLAATLGAHPGARAVVVVSPTYFGSAADLAGLAAVCHARAIPLIVDEAWGPHFAFHPAFPPSAMAAGADIGVTSIHKVLSGFSQASLLNVQGRYVDPDRVAMWVHMLETTSPSALILASIDAARRQMALRGYDMLDRLRAIARDTRAAIDAVPGLRAISHAIEGQPGVTALDPTKVVVDVRQLGVSGYAAEMWLREHARIAVEMSDHRRLVALLTVADDAASVALLVDGLRRLATAHRDLPAAPRVASYAFLLADLDTESVLTPREALFAPARHIPLRDAEGTIAADTITPYPPGIPALAPGERITALIVAYLTEGLASGMYVTGIADRTRPMIRVVR